MKTMKIGRCAELLKEQDYILLLTHRNPDGDTVGSAAALCLALRRLGKHAFLYPNAQISRKLMPYAGPLFAPEGSEEMFCCYAAIDVASESLLPQGFQGKVDLCVDHHESNTHYAAEELIQPECSSCGEVVLKLIKALCGMPDAEEATLLYIAVTTDTGCFQYLNTNARTLSAASELLSLGAEHAKVVETFFRKVSPARLRLEGEIYSSLAFYRGGELAVATVTREMLARAGAEEDDCEDLAGLAGRTEGAKVNVTIRELPDGGSRVSVRSTPEVNSSAICAVFGGGGHAMAAGCTIPAGPEKARTMLLAVIDELWNERHPSDR